MRSNHAISRRTFLAAAGAALAHSAEPVIDIHQHTPYSGRTDEELVQHQHTMGITKTVMLPAGREGGLAAGAGGNEVVVAFCRAHPGEYVFFANELPDIPETKKVIEKFLKAGAIGIGEQKFHVECDSKPMQMLEKFPKVNFIGHAQTWWGNIDKNHQQSVMYPKGPVTPGGITDRLLTDYPNVYGDLSAGSGLNALLRDENNARDFLKRHQDKLIYGSDCSDKEGAGPTCSGSQQLATVRRLAPDDQAVRKMLYVNATRVMKIS